ncbi:hypothetical protein F4604DRAFT_1687326 [Suillus subluteus]|nr:hypothetical protein F4604DRAFT_1687326 [Suillus subluteus]
MSMSFTNYILGAISTITIHPVHHTKDEMDILMKSELGLQHQDPWVLWEEDLQPRTSILRSLILLSNLNKLEIKKVTHIKRVPGSHHQIYGAPVFDKGWRLKDPFPSQRRQKVLVRHAWLQSQTETETDTDVEEDSMLEMEGSLGEQAFIQTGTKRTKPAGETEEKGWERLFRAIYYHMPLGIAAVGITAVGIAALAQSSLHRDGRPLVLVFRVCYQCYTRRHRFMEA